ncbi:acyl carrier protein [Spirillospora sp. CA-294931]|uniref:acyl carrier protein n=1 Tax=Spirillospora sp. CA-294931 TaxID=3240042 RepID=UPI003D8AA9C0
MSTDEVVDSVRTACADVLEIAPDAVVPGADLREDLGADSLDIAEVYTALEDVWGLEILDQEVFASVATVADVVEQVRRLREAM